LTTIRSVSPARGRRGRREADRKSARLEERGRAPPHRVRHCAVALVSRLLRYAGRARISNFCNLASTAARTYSRTDKHQKMISMNSLRRGRR
jgi:hypothetical protein